MNFRERYEKLNDAQKEAVDTIDGPVMVVAGPGTGKTELLSMRTANILEKTDTLPENILCLTFTESGAAAMRERLFQIIGTDAYKVAIHTFHSFGTEVINQNGEFFYHGANFRAADELSCYEILRKIFDELSYDNPLAGKMNGEYTYLSDTLQVISELKKSGLTSDELLQVIDTNEAFLDRVESQLSSLFAERLLKTTTTKLLPIAAISREHEAAETLPSITSLAHVFAESLYAAIDEVDASNSTKALTAWRNKWLKKDNTGTFIFKDREKNQKLRAVAAVYFQYLSRMQEAELYDFDDMILRVVHAMEVFNDLRFNLQEKYQYIMVDEFQDTNLAQMRILSNLTNREVTNERPNILVVGDDDQAIYSFQGADVSNINSFREHYKNTKLITLKDNYRSGEMILRRARSVITIGEDRLENRIPELSKALTAHKIGGTVKLEELPTKAHEHAWLAKNIVEQIESGVPAASIAVLARRHYELMALLPYLIEKGIAINYERRDNILDLEVIQAIELVARILVALFEGKHKDADSLLPELLTHPAFAIPPADIWHLSLKASSGHLLWMEVLSMTPEFTELHEWLISSSQKIKHTPLERMIDSIIGVPPEDRLGEVMTTTSSFVSPFYQYFFAKERLNDVPDSYLTCLEALRTIRTKLREYQPGEEPKLQTFLEFIRMHRELGSSITSIRPALDATENAVTLMTAHKSKGLEYEHIYIMDAVDSMWGERVRTRSRLIGYPENLPLTPAGDTFDERLRLFFVAMTRAKSQLVITYSKEDDNGKELLRASFLSQEPWQAHLPAVSSKVVDLTHAAEKLWYAPLVQPLSQDMRTLLLPTLETYKLSSTHLNNFLDVSRGGPQAFLMQNLLHFPASVSPSAGFGLAIHATLQRAHAHLAATGRQRPLEDILHDYEENLRNQHLDDDNFQALLQKGTDTLTAFLEATYDTFTKTQRAELSFAGQNVYLGQAHLTGTLDLVDIVDDTITITDYKTGKAALSWAGKTDYEKIKLHRYKQQLMFYNLLILNSRSYRNLKIKKAAVQFVEPTKSGEIVRLEAQFSPEDLQQFTRLIQAVWQHIIALNLPDVSSYDPTYKGLLAFEADLLEHPDSLKYT